MIKIKGIIPCGGLSTRLYPCTKIIGKHLLPVYDKPMIYYGIDLLKKAGIEDLMIITNLNSLEDSLTVIDPLINPEEVNLKYQAQVKTRGIAHAVSLAERFSDKEPIAVLLGDNIFENPPIEEIKNFKGRGAKVFLKKVSDPERFGVAEISKGKVIDIIEKPEKPKTNYAVIGLYLYDNKVFDYIRTLRPSERGEYEITDLNNIYIEKGQMEFAFVKGRWIDAGTFESLFEASALIKKLRKNG